MGQIRITVVEFT